MSLGILGGSPARREPWPRWPLLSPRSRELLNRALDSDRWTISGQSWNPPRFDREIGERWAAYLGVRHALPCSSGTAGLTMALEALEIGPGDEVIVPGMTWVAVPQTVFNVGAVPVIVDIDPKTLSIDPEAVRAAITPKTRAILVVHAYAGLADLDALATLSKEYSVPLIEDASQAHGAEWRGLKAGSFGKISVASTQQSKLLTSGEGGLVATDDEELYFRLQHARMDGRHYADEVSSHNWMCLAGNGRWQGRNFNPTEMVCAILVGALEELDEQTERRRGNIEHLAERLDRIGVVEVVRPAHGVTRRAAWRLPLRVNLDAFAGLSAREVGRAVSAEIGLPIEPVDSPFDNHPLYQPLLIPRIARRQDADLFDPRRFHLPNAHDQHPRILAIPQFALLGTRRDVDDIAAAFERVLHHGGEIVQRAQLATA